MSRLFLRRLKLPAWNLNVSVGAYGGFYVTNGFCKRLCLGWLAFTLCPVEFEDLARAYIKESA